MMNRARGRAGRSAPRTADRHIDRTANFTTFLQHTPISDNAVHNLILAEQAFVDLAAGSTDPGTHRCRHLARRLGRRRAGRQYRYGDGLLERGGATAPLQHRGCMKYVAKLTLSESCRWLLGHHLVVELALCVSQAATRGHICSTVLFGNARPVALVISIGLRDQIGIRLIVRLCGRVSLRFGRLKPFMPRRRHIRSLVGTPVCRPTIATHEFFGPKPVEVFAIDVSAAISPDAPAAEADHAG